MSKSGELKHDSGGNLILTRGSHFEGRLSFEGIARLCSFFKGEITSPGILIVEEEGRVEGKILVKELVVKGWVKGEIEASGQVSLLSGSEFYGSIQAGKLHIEPGAFFEGASLNKSSSN